MKSLKNPSSAAQYVQQLIDINGELTVAEFMHHALSHPEHGYYTSKNPFGRGGDFITAPEVSQVFGELLGICFAANWQQMGQPESIILVEIGPGRGTLMQDIIRGTEHIADFHAAIDSIHLVETSPTLQKIQQETLKNETLDIRWHQYFSEVPDKPIFLVANELFDALPIHQYQKTKEGWKERIVQLEGDELVFALSDHIVPQSSEFDVAYKDAKPNAIVEISPLSISLAQDIALHIMNNGGMGVMIDYGYEGNGYKDTLQAVKDHQYHPVLDDIGHADLTAHVNFTALLNAMSYLNVATYGPVSQSSFLQRLGIETRVGQLLAHANEDKHEDILSRAGRLIDPEQMGALFKVIAVSQNKTSPLVGF